MSKDTSDTHVSYPKLEDVLARGKLLWPDEWQDQFGRNRFFYLFGVRHFLAPFGLTSGTRLRKELVDEVERANVRYPEEWWSTYPNIDQAYSDEAMREHGLASLKKEIVHDVVATRPLSFPKASLAVCLLGKIASRLSEDEIDYTPLTIHLANCHIPALSAFLLSVSEIDLMNATPPLGGIPARAVIDDLCVGFPVTRLFAERLKAELSRIEGVDKAEIEKKLVIQTYANVDDVRDAVTANDQVLKWSKSVAWHERDVQTTDT